MPAAAPGLRQGGKFLKSVSINQNFLFSPVPVQCSVPVLVNYFQPVLYTSCQFHRGGGKTLSVDKMSVKGDWNEDTAALARHCRHETSECHYTARRCGDKKVGVAWPLSSARRSAHHHYTSHPPASALSALSTVFGNTQEFRHSYNKIKYFALQKSKSKTCCTVD